MFKHFLKSVPTFVRKKALKISQKRQSLLLVSKRLLLESRYKFKKPTWSETISKKEFNIALILPKLSNHHLFETSKLNRTRTILM